MEIRYIDIHSHLNLPQFADDADVVAVEMAQQGVAAITVGTTLADSWQAIALAEKHAHLFACVGIHPVHEGDVFADIRDIAELAAHPRVVAIGETGLDYFHASGVQAIAQQRELFLAQLAIAIEYDKPLMLHIRPSPKTVDAYDDMLELLTQHKTIYGERLRGNVHFFAGIAAQAQAFNTLGFSVSFTGVITFTHDYDDVVRAVPLAMMHAETDAPFVAPAPYRGQRNVPSYVHRVYETIATIRGEDTETVRLQLIQNARQLFGI